MDSHGDSGGIEIRNVVVFYASGYPCIIFWLLGLLWKPARASPSATSSHSVAHWELHPRAPRGAGYGFEPSSAKPGGFSIF